MQTFLPFEDFKQSAVCLDYRRLGKQRVEVLQLLKGQWPNHPASKMWIGSRFWLILYGCEICKEWISRGYKDTCFNKIFSFMNIYINEIKYPSWLGNEDFHLSHRSNLLRKNKEWYSQFFDCQDNLSYIWPENKDNELWV